MNRSIALAGAAAGFVMVLASCGSSASRSGSGGTTSPAAVSSSVASSSVVSSSGVSTAGAAGSSSTGTPTSGPTAGTVTPVSADPNIDPQFCALIKQYSADSAAFGSSTTTEQFKARLPVIAKELTNIAAVSPASVKADVSAAALAMTHLDSALSAVGYDPSKITDNTAVQSATGELNGVDEQQFDAVAQANCGISLSGSSTSTGTTPAT